MLIYRILFLCSRCNFSHSHLVPAFIKSWRLGWITDDPDHFVGYVRFISCRLYRRHPRVWNRFQEETLTFHKLSGSHGTTVLRFYPWRRSIRRRGHRGFLHFRESPHQLWGCMLCLQERQLVSLHLEILELGQELGACQPVRSTWIVLGLLGMSRLRQTIPLLCGCLKSHDAYDG